MHRSTGVNCLHTSLQGALVGDNLLQAMELYADIVRRPQLDAGQFGPCLELALQALDSLEDDPHQKIAIIAQEKFLPYPIGRPACGKREELQALTADEAKGVLGRGRISRAGAILAVAGKFEIEELIGQVEKIFGSWRGESSRRCRRRGIPSAVLSRAESGVAGACGDHVSVGPLRATLIFTSVDGGVSAVGRDGQQAVYGGSGKAGVVLLGARLASGDRAVRGGAVLPGQHAGTGAGGSGCDAGGIAKDWAKESRRKNWTGRRWDCGRRLIMQGESTSAGRQRARRDYFYLKRVRSLDEIENAIRSLTVEEINDYLDGIRRGISPSPRWGPRNLTSPRNQKSASNALLS